MIMASPIPALSQGRLRAGRNWVHRDRPGPASQSPRLGGAEGAEDQGRFQGGHDRVPALVLAAALETALVLRTIRTIRAT